MNNLKGIDILVLHYLNYNTTASNLEQVFWKHRYFIEPKECLPLLSELNLFEYKKDPYLSLNKLTLPNLKNILKENNLKLTGKKQILIERIINECSFESYSSVVTENLVVTDKGKNLLRQTQFILDVHNHLPEYSNPNILFTYYLNNKHLSSLELICNYIENEMNVNDGYGLGYSTFTLHKLAKLCIHEKQYYKAIDYLIEACFESINYKEIKLLINWTEFNFDYFKSRISIPPVFIDTLSKLLSNNAELLPYFNNTRINYYYNDEFFQKEDVSQLILDYINKNTNSIEQFLLKYYKLSSSKTSNDKTTISSTQKIETIYADDKKGCLIPFLLILTSLIFIIL